VEVVVSAAPETVYALVADLPRMGEWSPECRSVDWAVGYSAAAVGARFVGRNKGGPAGLMSWSRRGRVLTADAGQELAFVTEEGGRESTEWRYLFEPVGGGTRVTESYHVHWIPTWARILDVPTNRAAELRDGMQRTLDRLKATAEARTGTVGNRS
jgi:uncharacterized protein YndB with AHSA1/START domain